MSIRVNPDLYLETLNGLSQTQQSEASALQQLSTGKRVNTPSDDPAAAAANVGLQYQMAADDQYNQSMSSVTGALQTADSTLSSVTTLLDQAITYGTEAGGSGLSASNRQVLAAQIQNVQSQIVNLANTTYQGDYIFAGTATQTKPFTADPTDPTGMTIQYNGNSSTNSVEISSGQMMQTSVSGDQIFAGSANVFNALQQMAQAAQSGSDMTAPMASLQAALQQISGRQAVYGNAEQRLQNTESFLASDKVELSQQQNNLIGVDLDQAVTNMQQAATARQAALSAGGQINQLSLLNYLPQS